MRIIIICDCDFVLSFCLPRSPQASPKKANRCDLKYAKEKLCQFSVSFFCFAQREALLEGGKPVSNITIRAKVIATVPTKKGIAAKSR